MPSTTSPRPRWKSAGDAVDCAQRAIAGGQLVLRHHVSRHRRFQRLLNGHIEPSGQENQRQHGNAVDLPPEGSHRSQRRQRAQRIADHQYLQRADAVGPRAHRIGGQELHDISPYIEQPGYLGGVNDAKARCQQLGGRQNEQAV